MKICITGGIGSGKSEVAKALKSLGEVVISADEINAQLLTEPEYQKRLEALFPGSVKGGVVNKPRIKFEILDDPQKRTALNNMAHEEIYARMQAKASQVELCFCEVPLLDKAKIDFFDRIWFVTANKDTRLKRIIARDNVKPFIAEEMIKIQSFYDCIIPLSHAIIHNDGDLDALYAEVKRLLKEVRAGL